MADAAVDAVVDATVGLADVATALADAAMALPAAPTNAALCPGPTKPAADANWGDVHVPDTAGCAQEEPQFFKGAPLPPKQLTVELGAVNSSGVFVPYQDGDWVPLNHGLQLGFHVWASLRVNLPGSTVPKAKLQTDMGIFAGCVQVSYGDYSVVYPTLHSDGSYFVGTAETPGIEMRFSYDPEGKPASPYAMHKVCNNWYELRAAVRDMASQKWGAASVRLRAFDVF